MKFHQYISFMLFILVIIILQDFQKQLFQQVINAEKFNSLINIASITGDEQDQKCTQRKLPSIDTFEGIKSFKINTGNFHHENDLYMLITRKPCLPPGSVVRSKILPNPQNS